LASGQKQWPALVHTKRIYILIGIEVRDDVATTTTTTRVPLFYSNFHEKCFVFFFLNFSFPGGIDGCPSKHKNPQNYFFLSFVVVV
jgi:hypothetical protein